jgi:hypothetical protein
MDETLPGLEQTLHRVDETLPGLEQNLHRMGKTLPGLAQTLHRLDQTASGQDKMSSIWPRHLPPSSEASERRQAIAHGFIRG